MSTNIQITVWPHDQSLDEECRVFEWCDGHTELDAFTGGNVHVGRGVKLTLPATNHDRPESAPATFELQRIQEGDEGESSLQVEFEPSLFTLDDVREFAGSLRQVATYLEINARQLLGA